MTTIHRDIANKLNKDIERALSNYVDLARTCEIPEHEIIAGLMATITCLLMAIKSQKPALIDLLVEVVGKNDISTG